MNEWVTNRWFERMFWWLMGIAALLLLVRLGAAPVYILDEAKNAQCAREMWHRGNLIVPTFNGELRTDKPPLHYWFMAISYQVAGVGPFQARFFSAILGIATLLLTFSRVGRYQRAGVAFFSALALLLSPHFLFEFRLAVPDPYLIFFTTGGLFMGFSYLEKGSIKALLAGSIFLGLAILSKGPIALALPGLIFLLYTFLQKKWKALLNPWLLVALAILLLLALPWYWLVHQATAGAFTTGFFLEHNLNRFSAEKEGHGGPFFITPLMVLLGMLPFSIPLIGFLRKRFGFWREPLFLFSGIVVLVYVAFFSISSTKLPNYPMPCYPFLAVMAGFILNAVFEKRHSIATYNWWIWLAIGCIIPIGGFFALRAEAPVASLAWVAIPLLMLPIGLLIAMRQRDLVKKGLAIFSVSWLSFSAHLLWVGYPLVYNRNPITSLFREIPEIRRLGAYRSFNPAILFNQPDHGFHVPTFGEAKIAGQWADSLSKIDQRENIYLVTRLEHAVDLQGTNWKEVFRERDLFELPTTVVFKWEP